jgi:hypothetical protein
MLRVRKPCAPLKPFRRPAPQLLYDGPLDRAETDEMSASACPVSGNCLGCGPHLTAAADFKATHRQPSWIRWFGSHSIGREGSSRRASVANDKIQATAYCVCDIAEITGWALWLRWVILASEGAGHIDG